MEIGYYPGWEDGLVMESLDRLAADGKLKKEQKTRESDLNVAYGRMQNVLNGKVRR